MVVLITLALTAGVVLGASCASEEAGSQADFQVIARSPEQIISNVTPQQAFVMLKEAIALAKDDVSKRNDFRVIDIRGFGQIELEGGISMRPLPVDYVYYKTPSVFGNKLGNLDRSKTYLLYGQTGELSGGALAILGELGFMEVYNMLGGFDAWQAEGLPTIIIDCEEEGE
jgi:rhodanese-related sulfurtransferase